MRSFTTLAVVCAFALVTAGPAIACSGHVEHKSVQSPAPAEAQQTVRAPAQTPAPAGALTTPTETAASDPAKSVGEAPVKAN